LRKKLFWGLMSAKLAGKSARSLPGGRALGSERTPKERQKTGGKEKGVQCCGAGVFLGGKNQPKMVTSLLPPSEERKTTRLRQSVRNGW